MLMLLLGEKMPKAFIYEVRFLVGTENEYLLERVAHTGDRQALPYEADDAHWLALLSRQSSFRFLGRQGSLSICLGSPYHFGKNIR